MLHREAPMVTVAHIVLYVSVTSYSALLNQAVIYRGPCQQGSQSLGLGALKRIPNPPKSKLQTLSPKPGAPNS